MHCLLGRNCPCRVESISRSACIGIKYRLGIFYQPKRFFFTTAPRPEKIPGGFFPNHPGRKKYHRGIFFQPPRMQKIPPGYFFCPGGWGKSPPGIFSGRGAVMKNTVSVDKKYRPGIFYSCSVFFGIGRETHDIRTVALHRPR